MFYAKSTGGFYTPEINWNNIPDDALEITDDKYLELLQAQSDGKIITSDDKGNPFSLYINVDCTDTRRAYCAG